MTPEGIVTGQPFPETIGKRILKDRPDLLERLGKKPEPVIAPHAAAITADGFDRLEASVTRRFDQEDADVAAWQLREHTIAHQRLPWPSLAGWTPSPLVRIAPYLTFPAAAEHAREAAAEPQTALPPHGPHDAMDHFTPAPGAAEAAQKAATARLAAWSGGDTITQTAVIAPDVSEDGALS